MARRCASTQWRARVGPSQRDRRHLRNSNCFWGGSAPRRARERRARFVESRLDGIGTTRQTSLLAKRVSRPPGAHTRPRDAMASASRPAAGPPSCSRAIDPVSRRAVSSPSAIRRGPGTRALGSLGGVPRRWTSEATRARARRPAPPFARIASERAAERASSAHVAAAFAWTAGARPWTTANPRRASTILVARGSPRRGRGRPPGGGRVPRGPPHARRRRSRAVPRRGAHARGARRRPPPRRARALPCVVIGKEATSSSTTEDSGGRRPNSPIS